MIAAVAGALAAHPDVNASFDDNAVLRHNDVNVAFALALQTGLIAPTILRADKLSVNEIQSERRRLTAAAHEGALKPEELLTATFTISNLGPFGIRRFRALVVPPQAAILAVGELTAAETMSLSLSCDHRVLDGAPAARFLRDVTNALQDSRWITAIIAGAIPSATTAEE